MHVAFYAPLKAPDHPVPSGDRRVAALLMEAIGLAGHRVSLADRLRSRDAGGDPLRQARLARIGRARAERLLRRYRAAPPELRPDLWFTYHLYYKAPDWIGPRVAEGLGIPYVVAEASVAEKRADGPWDSGHRATLAALERAALVVTLNPRDAECLPDQGKVRLLPPFLDLAPLQRAAQARAAERRKLATRLSLDPAVPWIAAVAMMREGDKLSSYRLLAEALRPLDRLDWRLLVIGDGPTRSQVEAAFAGLALASGVPRIHFLGALEPKALAATLAACDLLAWPAVREAFGMALLEAQAIGLPVVAGRSGGVPAIVRHGETGLLTPEGDAERFAEALRGLVENHEPRHRLGANAAQAMVQGHGLAQAAGRLDEILHEALAAEAKAPQANASGTDAAGAAPTRGPRPAAR